LESSGEIQNSWDLYDLLILVDVYPPKFAENYVLNGTHRRVMLAASALSMGLKRGLSENQFEKHVAL